MELNKYQTPIDQLVYNRVVNGKTIPTSFKDSPQEVQDEFNEILATVPLVQWLISKDRPNIKDLPRDEEGKAVWRIEYPPIIENVDYFRPTAIHYMKTGKLTDLRPNPNPNSSYMKWLNEEVRRIRKGYLREEDGAYITGDMYFYLNYCPIVLTKKIKGTDTGYRTMGFPEFWEGVCWRYTGWQLARTLGQHFGEISARGKSKAHPYCQEAITPEGPKLWRDIQIGDTLFGDDGLPTKVVDIPFDGTADIYKVTLRDGRTVLASDEHLWRVKIHGRKNEEILSTKELISIYKRKRKVSERNPNGIELICGIPANKAVDFDYSQTKVDPYTFGLLLGDGCFRHPCCYYTCKTDDFENVKRHIPYRVSKWSGKYAYNIHIPFWKKILRDYGLDFKKSEDKFIPDEYKYNSREVRLNILKGLMDSDGYIDTQSQLYTISTTSKRLAEDIRWICYSLGYNTLCNKVKAGYKVNGVYKECLPAYIISIYTCDAIVNLPRKVRTNYWSGNYAKSRAVQTRISDIEYVGKMPAKCVTVDNESNCYLIGDFVVTHNSYTLASKLTKIFVVGEKHDDDTSNPLEKDNERGVVMAYQKEFLTKDGTLNKFEDMFDFLATNTQFPRKTLTRSLGTMDWVMGYIDLNTGAKKGTGNEIMGVAIKDDPNKARGKRAQLIGLEEFGSFPNVAEVIKTAEPSVKEGDLTFGLMVAIGTGGSEGNDFSGALDMIYHPSGSHFLSFENVWDKAAQSRGTSIFCFPSYINRKGCYNEDGISDVTKALFAICWERYIAKYENPDPMALTRTKAENPITLQDAIMKRDGTKFPVAQITERIQEIDLNPNFYDKILSGKLIQRSNGEVEFEPTGDKPIHKFPTKDNKVAGAVEIKELPKKNREGRVYAGRYILSLDPVDDDNSNTMSLVSCFVLDLWTDEIVAEWTGRLNTAEDCYEVVRLMCKFYNGKLLYENDKKGAYSYFKMMNSLNLLAETPQFIKDREDSKIEHIGNKAYGVKATSSINNYGRDRLKDFMLKPVEITKIVDGQEQTITVPNVMTWWNRALLEEARQWNPDGNFDRISSMGIMMLYREEVLIMNHGEIDRNERTVSQKVNDPFFERNYHPKTLNKPIFNNNINAPSTAEHIQWWGQ